jgi:hypothetical protein
VVGGGVVVVVVVVVVDVPSTGRWLYNKLMMDLHFVHLQT